MSAFLIFIVMCDLYILYSKTADKYYVGITANLNDRLERHNGGRSKATNYRFGKQVGDKTQTVRCEQRAWR